MELRADSGVLYEQHVDRLLKLATVLAGPAVAEDVVSTALVRVLGSPGWNDVENPGAYLTQTVVNVVKTNHRGALRREARERANWVRSDVDGPESATDVFRALAELPVRQRAAVFLTYWMDLGVDDVAAELGISSGSVRKHLARARKSLRKRLA